VASDIEREAERVRAAYARREALGLDGRYAYWQPANLYTYQSRERQLLKLLRSTGMLPLAGRVVLDVGCGDGAVLDDCVRYGAAPEDLHGVDLLGARIDVAKRRLPGATIRIADAQSLPYEDTRFDLVLAFTLLSSVTDADARRRVAQEMQRVTKPNGLIVLYDFWTNPLNRHVKPLRQGEYRSLFPGRPIEFRRATLAPPLTRLLVKAPGGWFACSFLEVIPFLRTHYLAAVRV
jgi:SAM-dependent methyltransferase